MFSLAFGCSFVSHPFPLLFRRELQFSPGINLISVRSVFYGWNSPSAAPGVTDWWFISAIVMPCSSFLISLGINVGCKSRQWDLLEKRHLGNFFFKKKSKRKKIYLSFLRISLQKWDTQDCRIWWGGAGFTEYQIFVTQTDRN